jgi:hypothetical protein
MSVKLTDAQLVMMSAGAQRKDRCLSAPATIKGAFLMSFLAVTNWQLGEVDRARPDSPAAALT